MGACASAPSKLPGVVELIVDKRVAPMAGSRGARVVQYMVRWKGYTSAADCWVLKSDLDRHKHTRELIVSFEREAKFNGMAGLNGSIHSSNSLQGLVITEEGE
jgi:hypothetical protein